MKRVVIYTRTAAHNPHSLNKQMEICRLYAAEKGYQIVDEIAKTGSGNTIPDFGDSEFDLIVATTPDRITRSPVIVESLREQGVSIEYTQIPKIRSELLLECPIYGRLLRMHLPR